MPNVPLNIAAFLLLAAQGFAAELPPQAVSFLDDHCIECHDPDDEEG